MNSPVLSIDYDNKVVTAEVEGKEHKESYEKLIFATGSTPILPPIEGVEIVKGNREFKATLENVQFVKLYQNAEEVINKLADKSKTPSQSKKKKKKKKKEIGVFCFFFLLLFSLNMNLS